MKNLLKNPIIVVVLALVGIAAAAPQLGPAEPKQPEGKSSLVITGSPSTETWVGDDGRTYTVEFGEVEFGE